MTDAEILEFLDDVFIFSCGRRIGDAVDTERVMVGIDAALRLDRVARFHQRFVVPARTRLLDQATKSQLPLARWLPAPVTDVLKAALGQPVKIPRWVIDEIVTSEAVRDEVRDLLEETLTELIRKAFTAGTVGVFGWGARAAGAATRGILGGVGDELRRGLEDRMRELLGGAVAMAQKRIARKLAAKETARDLGKRRQRAFKQLLKKTEAEVARLAAEVPFPVIDAATAPVVRHNLDRDEVRAALRGEIAAVLAELERQTVGELLDEYGLRELVQTTVRERGAPLVREFLAWREARP